MVGSFLAQCLMTVCHFRVDRLMYESIKELEAMAKLRVGAATLVNVPFPGGIKIKGKRTRGHYNYVSSHGTT